MFSAILKGFLFITFFLYIVSYINLNKKMSLIKYTCHSSRNTFCCKLAENYSFALQIIIQLQQEKTMIQSADVVLDPNCGHGDVHIVVSCVDIFAFPEGGVCYFCSWLGGVRFIQIS